MINLLPLPFVFVDHKISMFLFDGSLWIPQAQPRPAACVVAILPHKVDFLLCECGHRNGFDAMWWSQSPSEIDMNKRENKRMLKQLKLLIVLRLKMLFKHELVTHTGKWLGGGIFCEHNFGR